MAELMIAEGETIADSVGTKEAASTTGFSQATIRKWCQEKKKDPRVEQDAKGSPWRIPKDSPILRMRKNDIILITELPQNRLHSGINYFVFTFPAQDVIVLTRCYQDGRR